MAQADGGELILWKPTGVALPKGLKDDEIVENCSWKASRTLVGHLDDVQDLSWAPHSDMLLSGSVDNSCIVWDSLKCARPVSSSCSVLCTIDAAVSRLDGEV